VTQSFAMSGARRTVAEIEVQVADLIALHVVDRTVGPVFERRRDRQDRARNGTQASQPNRTRRWTAVEESQEETRPRDEGTRTAQARQTNDGHRCPDIATRPVVQQPPRSRGR
jgi:hypothetical protein